MKTDLASRLLRCARLLFGGRIIDAQLIMDEFRVSYATAKRDIVALEQGLPVLVQLVDTTEGKLPPKKRLRIRR